MTIQINLVNEEIRYLLGGLSVSVISDAILDKTIQRNIDKYGDSDEQLCKVTYQSLLDTLQYLINSEAAGTAGGSGGAVTKRREEIGARKIEINYSVDSIGTATSYQSLYDKFFKDPSLVCDSLKPTTQSSTVIIGGVSQKEYDRVKNNTDSRNGMSMIPSCRTRTSRRGY